MVPMPPVIFLGLSGILLFVMIMVFTVIRFSMITMPVTTVRYEKVYQKHHDDKGKKPIVPCNAKCRRKKNQK